jgi:hypothetical protein
MNISPTVLPHAHAGQPPSENQKWFWQQTPRRWGLGNPAEETCCSPEPNPRLAFCSPKSNGAESRAEFPIIKRGAASNPSSASARTFSFAASPDGSRAPGIAIARGARIRTPHIASSGEVRRGIAESAITTIVSSIPRPQSICFVEPPESTRTQQATLSSSEAGRNEPLTGRCYMYWQSAVGDQHAISLRHPRTVASPA